jgi:hypothetical protein
MVTTASTARQSRPGHPRKSALRLGKIQTSRAEPHIRDNGYAAYKVGTTVRRAVASHAAESQTTRAGGAQVKGCCSVCARGTTADRNTFTVRIG